MSAQPTEPKGTLSVIKPDAKSPTAKTEPRYVYDFGKLKRRERIEFSDDIQRSINFKEAGLTPDQADELALKWMVKLITKWPDNYDLSNAAVFEELSAVEWKEATKAFMDQFRTAFGVGDEEQ